MWCLDKWNTYSTWLLGSIGNNKPGYLSDQSPLCVVCCWYHGNVRVFSDSNLFPKFDATKVFFDRRTQFHVDDSFESICRNQHHAKSRRRERQQTYTGRCVRSIQASVFMYRSNKATQTNTTYTGAIASRKIPTTVSRNFPKYKRWLSP